MPREAPATVAPWCTDPGGRSQTFPPGSLLLQLVWRKAPSLKCGGQLTVAGPSLGIRYASANSAVVLEPWEALGKQPWACASHDGHPNLPSRSLIILVGAFLFAAVDWLELNHRLTIIFKCAILAAGGIAIAEQLLF
jgi:hypothetical protein